MTKQAKNNPLDFLRATILCDEVVSKLNDLAKPIYCKKGDIIVHEGTVCKNIYLVDKGIIRCYKQEGDTEVVHAFFKEKELYTVAESFFDDQATSMNVQAVEDCVLYWFPQQELKKLGDKYPSFAVYLYKELSQRLSAMLREKNILLTKTATERYLYFLETHPDLVHRVPLGHISAYLGMRQSSLSRVRRDIHKQFS